MHDVARPVSNRPMQSPPKRRRKGIVIAIALLLAICVFVVGIKFLQIGKMMSTPQTMPPTTVSERIGERGRLGSAPDSGRIG